MHRNLLLSVCAFQNTGITQAMKEAVGVRKRSQ